MELVLLEVEEGIMEQEEDMVAEVVHMVMVEMDIVLLEELPLVWVAVEDLALMEQMVSV